MWMSFKALFMVFVSFSTEIFAFLLSEHLAGCVCVSVCVMFQCIIWWNEMPVRAISTTTRDSFLSHIYCQPRAVVGCLCSRGSAAPWNQRFSHLSSLRASHSCPGKIRELLTEWRKDKPFCRHLMGLNSYGKEIWFISWERGAWRAAHPVMLRPCKQQINAEA